MGCLLLSRKHWCWEAALARAAGRVLRTHLSRKLPNSVDGGERVVVVLQSQLMLSILVGQQTGFPQQRLVPELSACQLLVNRLQAHQEHSMTKSTGANTDQCDPEDTRIHQSLIPLDCYRGDGASAIHTRSMLQDSTGSWADKPGPYAEAGLPSVRSTSTRS